MIRCMVLTLDTRARKIYTFKNALQGEVDNIFQQGEVWCDEERSS